MPSVHPVRLRAVPPAFAVLWAALLAVLTAGSVTAARPELEPAATTTDPATDFEVRRWEYVILVRTSHQVPTAPTKAEDAALRAGGAVLDVTRTDSGPGWSDHRYLLRTRRPEAIDQILASIRKQAGVLGATSVKLPETPTWPGGPSFMSAWTGESSDPSNAGRVVMRADRPEVLDKRDLLEITEVPTGPGLTEAGTLGGFSLNVSQMIKNVKAAAWLRREQNMKESYLPILPEDAAAVAAPAPGAATP